MIFHFIVLLSPEFVKANYVESDYNLVMDIDVLEKKLVKYPNCKFYVVSHVRGKLTDMDKLKDACDRHSVWWCHYSGRLRTLSGIS